MVLTFTATASALPVLDSCGVAGHWCDILHSLTFLQLLSMIPVLSSSTTFLPPHLLSISPSPSRLVALASQHKCDEPQNLERSHRSNITQPGVAFHESHEVRTLPDSPHSFLVFHSVLPPSCPLMVHPLPPLYPLHCPLVHGPRLVSHSVRTSEVRRRG